MPSLGDFLRPLSEPLAPLVRQRLLRALRGLPGAASLGSVTIDGAHVRLHDLVLVQDGAPGVRIAATRVVFRVVPRGWLVKGQAEVCLEALEGELRVDPFGPFLGTTTKILFRPSGRRDHWVDGHLVLELEGGKLALTSSLEIGPRGAILGDLRLAGPRTTVRGALAFSAATEGLSGTLSGALAPSDLPLGPLARSAVELGELALPLSLELGGTRTAPTARLETDLGGSPLRPVGQRRFLPHLRIERGLVRATLSAARTAFEATLEPNGGGRLEVSGEVSRTGLRASAALEGLTTGTLQHLLTLAGASGLTLRGGRISGRATLEASSHAPHAPHAPHAESAHLDAELVSDSVTLELGDVQFPLDRPRLRLEGALGRPSLSLEADVDGGALTLAKPAGEELSVKVRGASPRVLLRLARAARSRTTAASGTEGLVLPETALVRLEALTLPALEVDLDAHPRPGGNTLGAEASIRGDGTDVRVALDVLEGVHRASRLDGTLTFAHAKLLLDLPTLLPGLDLAGDAVAFDLSVLGSELSPSLVGTLRTGRTTTAFDGRALTSEAATICVHIAPSWIAFEDLEVRIGQGSVRGAGVVSLGGDAPVARVHLTCSDTRVGRQELFPEGPPIDGRVFAHAALRLGAGGVRDVRAEVHVRLERPVYTFLPKATARLSRLGLPRVPIAGDSALEAHAVLERGKVRVHTFRASVPGLRASGKGEGDTTDRRIAADLALVVDRAWLSQSALFALPGALLGWVEVPVEVRGSVDRPETRSALTRAIYKSLTRDLGARRAGGGALALGPRSLHVDEEPFDPGSDRASWVRTLVRGALPCEDLEALAVRFVAE